MTSDCCAFRMTDTTATDFVSQLLANVEEYQGPVAEEYMSSVREEASAHYEQMLLTSDEAKARFEALASHHSKTGSQDGRPVTNMTAPVHTWQGRSESYKGVALSDLLDRDDLLTRLQDWINATYGEGKLRIFNHQVRNSRDTRLTVSWNTEGFKKIDEIIEKNRKRAQMNLEKQQRRREEASHGDDDRSHRDYDDRDDRRGPRRDYRPRRDYDDRDDRGPRRDYRPRRDFGDRGDRDYRPRRDYGDRDDRRGPRRNHDERGPRRDDRPLRGDRSQRRDEESNSGPGPGPTVSRRSQAVASFEE